MHEDAVAMEDDHRAGDVIQIVPVGFGETLLPNQGLEPEKVRPGVGFQLPGSSSSILGDVDHAGHDLAVMENAVEAFHDVRFAADQIGQKCRGRDLPEGDDPLDALPRRSG